MHRGDVEIIDLERRDTSEEHCHMERVLPMFVNLPLRSPSKP